MDNQFFYFRLQMSVSILLPELFVLFLILIFFRLSNSLSDAFFCGKARRHQA